MGERKSRGLISISARTEPSGGELKKRSDTRVSGSEGYSEERLRCVSSGTISLAVANESEMRRIISTLENKIKSQSCPQRARSVAELTCIRSQVIPADSN